MTLKQKMLLKKLPENNYNVSKTAKEVGYKDTTSQSGFIYSNLRKITNKLDFFDEEKIKRDIALTFRLAKKEKDITNMARINEHRSKIAGMITDKSENKNLNINEEKRTEIDGYYDNLFKKRLPVEKEIVN